MSPGYHSQFIYSMYYYCKISRGLCLLHYIFEGVRDFYQHLRLL